jgi:hypothetical protein
MFAIHAVEAIYDHTDTLDVKESVEALEQPNHRETAK